MELILIPTAHVSKKSVQKVRGTIREHAPDVVAVELDKQRAVALLTGKKPSFSTLLRHPGFLIMYLAQQFIGFIFRSSPGEEMKTALIEAGILHIPILLADMPIQKIIDNLKKIPFKEKLRIILPIKIKGIKSIDALVEPEKLRPLLEKIKEKYPYTYRYLLEERNKHIFDKFLAVGDKKVVGVFGAGHIPGLSDLVKKHNLKNPENKIKLTIVS